MPSILARQLDPISADPNTMIYKSALSMLIFIRNDLVRASTALSAYITALEAGEDGVRGMETPTSSSPKGMHSRPWGDALPLETLFGATKDIKTPNSIVKHRMRTPESSGRVGRSSRHQPVPVQGGGATHREVSSSSSSTSSSSPSPQQVQAQASKNAHAYVSRLRIGLNIASQPALRSQVIDAPLIQAVAVLVRSFSSACANEGTDRKTLSHIQVAVSTVMEAVAQVCLDGADTSIIQVREDR